MRQNFLVYIAVVGEEGSENQRLIIWEHVYQLNKVVVLVEGSTLPRRKIEKEEELLD
jgi:hypothetical protein